MSDSDLSLYLPHTLPLETRWTMWPPEGRPTMSDRYGIQPVEWSSHPSMSRAEESRKPARWQVGQQSVLMGQSRSNVWYLNRRGRIHGKYVGNYANGTEQLQKKQSTSKKLNIRTLQDSAWVVADRQVNMDVGYQCSQKVQEPFMERIGERKCVSGQVQGSYTFLILSGSASHI